MAAPGNAIVVDRMPCRLIGGKVLMSYDNAAEYLGISIGSIYNKVSAGELTRCRLGRAGFLLKEELDRKVLGDVA